jgi:glycosyltransferase involved in cell wall biosynthesis
MMSVDLVIPVYNEEEALEGSVTTLREFLRGSLSSPWEITIADNASTDRTLDIARSLAGRYPEVGYIHIPQKGRGRALRRAWLESKADIVAYMDVDLATDLHAFPLLLAAIDEGYDVAIGSRILKGAQVRRSFRREVLSRGYNRLIRLMFRPPFRDAQCGFKAVRWRAAQALVPLVKDQAWFFDTELLLLAHMKSYRIKEIPVVWREAAHTTVHVRKTVTEDIKGLFRMRFRR